MSKKSKIDNLFELTIKSQNNFKDIFNSNIDKIVDVSYKYYFFKHDLVNQKSRNVLSSNFYKQFYFNKDEFLSYEQKKFSLKLNKYKHSIEKVYNNYIESLNEFRISINEFKLSQIDSKTIENLFLQIDKLNVKEKEIFKNVSALNYNEYYIIKKEIFDVNYNLVSLIMNVRYLVKNRVNFVYNVDLSKLKKLPKSKLKKGDIILEQIDDKYNKFSGKFVSFFLRSPIIHAFMIYKNDGKNVFIYEINNYKEYINSKILPYKEKQNIDFIVLRYKGKINQKQISLFEEFIQESLSAPYNKFKTTGAFYYDVKSFLVEKLKIPLTKSKNPFYFSKGFFCSELIAKSYEKMGIRISTLGDNSMVFPLDLLNSSEFEILGVVSKK